MAVKYAISAGDFNSPSIWNDGTIPTENDDVYLNGYAVTLNVDYVTNGIISNGICPLTNNGGGHFTYSTNRIVEAHRLEAYNEYLFSSTAVVSLTINANYLYCPVSNSSFVYVGYTATNRTFSFIVNEIDCRNGFLIQTQYGRWNCNITGNVITSGNAFTTTQSGTSDLTINGNVVLNGSLGGSLSATINGNITANNNASISGTTLNINGNIYYKNTVNRNGINYINMNILNPDSFVWQDITEPRSNTFIILTNAEMNNRQQYPAENDVRKDVEYAWGVLKGQLEQVQVGCVTKEDVREGVPLLGMGENGTLVVPSADDVSEGVVFDNGTIGTLIVQGGGDRLRIADFGYYTNAQSDTYIVDLTEQDKPKFAVAEERVLIEMFPDLDFDNIPEKYFDDFFVKFLKYRLIVEYYRTAGINSTFTTSEPTTEIVNYRNVNCEIWMNIANTYLKAWGTKYPNSIKKQRILL